MQKPWEERNRSHPFKVLSKEAGSIGKGLLGFDPHHLGLITAGLSDSVKYICPPTPPLPQKEGKPKEKVASEYFLWAAVRHTSRALSSHRLSALPPCLTPTLSSAGYRCLPPRACPPGLWAPTLMSNYQVPGHLLKPLISSLINDHTSRKPQKAQSPAAWNFIWLWHQNHLEGDQRCV